MGRKLPLRVHCGHPGCTEVAFYEARTRKDYGDLFQRYGQGRWRCLRHTRMNENLSVDDRFKTFEIESREEPHGKFFGNFGILTGPGFKAYASDFPPGTKIRVTAEVILPPNQTP